MPEVCANCGQVMGSLEQPYLWGDYIVCGACSRKLAAQPPVQAAPVAPTGDDVGFVPSYATPSRRSAKGRPVQTVQLTSKTWKVQILLGAIVAILGVVLLMIGVSQSGGANSSVAVNGVTVTFVTMGTIFFALGFGWFVLAKVGAWWNHG